MDLRTERTLHNIKTAFLELRKQKPLEKITVKELADAMMLSKQNISILFSDTRQGYLSEKIYASLVFG